MPKKLIVNKGDRYNQLTIIEEVEKKNAARMFLCQCDCGNQHVVGLNPLRMGTTKSCGCHKAKTSAANGKKGTKHGMTGTKIYNIWLGMRKRCYAPSNPSFNDYGERGIKVCNEWLGKQGSANFINWAMSHGYRDGLSIERIDVNKGYSSENCTFIPLSQQGDNKRNTKRITYDGKTMLLKEWAEHLNLSYGALKRRLQVGWSVEKTFTTPIAKRRKQ